MKYCRGGGGRAKKVAKGFVEDAGEEGISAIKSHFVRHAAAQLLKTNI